jgi:hypothetical protein
VCHALEQYGVAEEVLKVASGHKGMGGGRGRIRVVVDDARRSVRQLREGAPEFGVALEPHDASRGRLAFAWQPSERAPRLERRPAVVGQHVEVDAELSQHPLNRSGEPFGRDNHGRTQRSRR